MTGVLLLTLLALTTYRITRLIIRDTFPPVRHVRNAIVGEDELKLLGTRLEWLGDLLTCHWCASVWVAGGLILVTQLVTGDVPYPLLAWPATASVAAWLLHREDPTPVVHIHRDEVVKI